MSYGRVLFASVVVIALAVVAVAYAPAIAQQARKSTYMISAEGDTFVWRVNISDGSVSYCRRDVASSDPKFVSRQKPFCSAGSGPAGH